MADVLATLDVLEVRFVCKANNQYSVNVRHFLVAAGMIGAPTLDTAAGGFDAKFAPLFKAILAQGASFFGVGVRRISPTVSLESLSLVGRGAGLVTGDLMSTQTTSVATVRTSLPGRKNRGRMFLPYPSETDNDATGRPLATYMATANAICVPLYSQTTYTVGAQNFKADGVLWHRSTRTYTPIAQAYVRPDWGTQRRRSQINRPDRAPF